MSLSQFDFKAMRGSLTYFSEPFPPSEVFHDSFVPFLSVWNVREELEIAFVVVVGVKFYPKTQNPNNSLSFCEVEFLP